MSKLEIMRKLVCLLLMWNLALTAGLLISFNQKNETDLNTKICNLEAIPPLELIEEEI